MNDINQLTAAIQSHAWPVVAGILMVALVAVAKLPAARAQWERIPAIYRPFLPILLGVLSGVGEALSTSQPWLPALLAGLATAIPAILLALPSPVADGKTVVVAADTVSADRVVISRKDG